jgi:putative ABC transport system permease protein
VLASLGPKAHFNPADLDAVRWFDISAPARIAELFYVGFMIFVGLAGTMTLLVGAVGIANYQLATLAERTVEIAVAKAIGAKRRTLVAQTVIEAIIVSGGSALLGVLMGLGCCLAVLSVVPGDTFPHPIVTPLGTGVTLMAVSAVAVVASIIPALQVRRMEIAAALRAGL